jgi:uncharacterized protein (TIGR00269 family)
MKCTLCDKPAVFKLPNMLLCKNHFLDYFEKKAIKTIQKYKLIERNDNICVATSGGKDSLSVLYIINQYCKKYKIPFFALVIDEGIKGYREHTIEDLKKFCKDYDIKLKIASFKETFGKSLDEIKDKSMDQLGKKPCTACGILRRNILNKVAREEKATKLVTGHNLDDEAQAYMMNLFLGNMGHNAALGPISGLSKTEKFVTRIKPLYFISEKETRLFAILKNFQVGFNECPNVVHSYRAQVRDMLNKMEEVKHGSKNGIVNSFLEILPELKVKYKAEKTKNKKYNSCKFCGEPSAGEVCNTCQLLKQLDLDSI